MQSSQIIQWQTFSGDPITVGTATITPQSQALTIHLPFGEFVWHRPTAVLVEQNGYITYKPILDVTRLIVWALAGITLIAAVFRRR